MKKKRIFIALLTGLLLFSSMGCVEASNPININSESIHGNVLGKDAMVEIGGGLYYDSTTRIVYWWNGYLDGIKWDTTPTPYYAPNGKPYTYNPETNAFEEIN